MSLPKIGDYVWISARVIDHAPADRDDYLIRVSCDTNIGTETLWPKNGSWCTAEALAEEALTDTLSTPAEVLREILAEENNHISAKLRRKARFALTMHKENK